MRPLQSGTSARQAVGSLVRRPGKASATTALTVGLCTAGEIWGGVELAVFLLASGLHEHGIDPVVILFHEGQLAEKLRMENVTVVVAHPTQPYSTLNVREVTRVIRSHGIHLLHTHGYKGTIWGGIAGASAKIPVIKTAHGRVERPASSGEWPGWVRLLAFHQLDRAVTRATVRTIVAVSDDLASALPQRAKPEALRIYNGVHPTGRSGSGKAPGPRFEIGIVGRVTAVKGHRILLAALHHLGCRDIILHVFGTGPLERECMKLTSELGLEGQVVFHGFCPDVQSRLGTLDALVMPSFSEGLPFALLEAMARGIPVIASAVGGIPEVIDDGVSGVLIPPGDVTRLAEAITRLRDNPALAQALAEGGLARIRERFDADDMIRRHAMLYRRTLGIQASGASGASGPS